MNACNTVVSMVSNILKKKKKKPSEIQCVETFPLEFNLIQLMFSITAREDMLHPFFTACYHPKLKFQ